MLSVPLLGLACKATQPNRNSLISTFSCFVCVCMHGYTCICLHEQLNLQWSSDNFLTVGVKLLDSFDENMENYYESWLFPVAHIALALLLVQICFASVLHRLCLVSPARVSLIHVSSPLAEPSGTSENNQVSKTEL